MDRIKYEWLWPRYIAHMHDLRANHSQTWEELQAGIITVTKSNIPFVSHGADLACEQLNRLMKIHSGLIGIPNNNNAWQRFFRVTPELSRLLKEFKSHFGHGNWWNHRAPWAWAKCCQEGTSCNRQNQGSHSELWKPLLQLIVTSCATSSPIPTFQVILNTDVNGQTLYEYYVAERINGDVSVWAWVKKENNNMFLPENKN